jgi:DNA-binding SARP family transcriptional activator
MAGIRVSLLGKFCIQNEQAEIFEFESRKAEELLCYLLMNRERAHTRDALAEVLWGDYTTQQSKNYLRKVLWQLQSALEPLVKEEEQHPLLVEPEWIQINPGCDLWLDVAVVEAAFIAVKGVSGRNLTREQARSLEGAVALYKGDLLEGWYRDWCLFERQRLQYLYLASLDKLMDYCEQRQDYESGLAHGDRVLRYDRAHERTHSRLMRLHYLAGDRTAALRQYEKCQTALQEELDVEPGKHIRQLYQQIRQDALKVDNNAGEEKFPPLDGAALQMFHTRLGHFQKALSQLQAQLQNDIRELEQVMRR